MATRHHAATRRNLHAWCQQTHFAPINVSAASLSTVVVVRAGVSSCTSYTFSSLSVDEPSGSRSRNLQRLSEYNKVGLTDGTCQLNLSPIFGMLIFCSVYADIINLSTHACSCELLQSGTHFHLAFATLPLTILSVAFLKLTASSKPSDRLP